MIYEKEEGIEGCLFDSLGGISGYEPAGLHGQSPV